VATQDYLGKDVKFPIQNKFQPTQGTDTLNQDIQILLATIPGERVQRPTYGCALFTRLWDNIDDVAQNGADDIRTAIDEFEPRVRLLRITAGISREQGTVQFTILYRVIESNTIENLVFPFNLLRES